MTSYTIGNWTVSSLYKDTLTTAKTISVVDLSYATDFKKASDEPDEAIITNVTGSELTSPENIRFGVSQVTNVYSGTNTDATSQFPSKKGVQVLVEISENYRAINKVTGVEVDLPCKGRLVLRVPNNSAVTPDLIGDLLMRTIAAAFATGKTTSSRVVSLVRGSLLPDGM